MEPVTHYRENKQFYDNVQNNLETLREEFERSDRPTQRRILLASHKFAVLSIQTPVDIHEAAFKELEGLGEPSEKLQRVNYWKNKINWINHAASQTEALDRVIDDLLAGEIDSAHRTLLDNFKGLGAKKAAFTLAMIGYTSKMCIDTNVAQIAGLTEEEEYTGVVIEKYENQCGQVRSAFKELDEELPPFMVQWVLFDTQRREKSSHDVFFNAVEKYLP